MTQPTSKDIPEWTLGWRIRRALEYGNVSVEEMATELGVARNTLSNWAHDKNPVRELFLKTIALRCGVPYEWLRSGLGGDAAMVRDQYPGDNLPQPLAEAS